jgi:predicted secreted protein
MTTFTQRGIKMSYWRLKPNHFVDAGVRAIATREGRSLSNAMHKLLTEALMAREKRKLELERIKALAAKAKAPSA